VFFLGTSFRKDQNMPNVDIIRAWKDEEYRLSLTDAERAMLPDNPAGLIQLEDEEMKAVLGAHGTHGNCLTVTFPKCCVTA
jgi:mersacidin/lichenicidin family type 2 lantibiotic